MKVRVFAGPNGSGKSTLIYSFEKGMKLNMGFIINADNIENELNTKRLYTFSKELILDSKRFFLIDNSQENNPELLLELENNKKINFINKTFYPGWAVPFSK